MLIHLAFPNHIVITTPQFLSATPEAGGSATANEKSSLSDFLFAGTFPTAATLPDFRTLAAAMFAEAVAGPAPSGLLTRGPAASKKYGDAPSSGGHETHNSSGQSQMVSNLWQQTACNGTLPSAALPLVRPEVPSKTTGADLLATMPRRSSAQTEIVAAYNSPASQSAGGWPPNQYQPMVLDDSLPAAPRATNVSDQSPNDYPAQLAPQAQQAAGQAIPSSDNLRSTARAAIGEGDNVAESLPHLTFHGNVQQSDPGGFAAEDRISRAVATASGSSNPPQHGVLGAQGVLDDPSLPAPRATNVGDQSPDGRSVRLGSKGQSAGQITSSFDSLTSTTSAAIGVSDNVAGSLPHTTSPGNVPRSGRAGFAPEGRMPQAAATASGSFHPPQDGLHGATAKATSNPVIPNPDHVQTASPAENSAVPLKGQHLQGLEQAPGSAVAGMTAESVQNGSLATPPQFGDADSSTAAKPNASDDPGPAQTALPVVAGSQPITPNTLPSIAGGASQPNLIAGLSQANALPAAQPAVPVQTKAKSQIPTGQLVSPNAAGTTPVNPLARSTSIGIQADTSTKRTDPSRSREDSQKSRVGQDVNGQAPQDAPTAGPPAHRDGTEIIHAVTASDPATGGSTQNQPNATVASAAAIQGTAELTKQVPTGFSDTARSNTPEASAQGDGVGTVPFPSVNTAKLIQGIGHSEFLVGIQSHEFGNIDIRTSVMRHEFTAQISVEHNDMAKTLVTELPSLYDRLGDQNVAVANIQIQSHGLATSSGFARNPQPQTAIHQNQGIAKSMAELDSPVITETVGLTGRLDIRI